MRKHSNFHNIFSGYLTKKGKKINAKKILNFAFFKLSTTFQLPLHILLRRVLKRMGNTLEVKIIKKRKSTFVIPFTMGFKRRTYLTAKKLMDSVKEDTMLKSFKERFVSQLNSVLIKDRYSKSLQKNKTLVKQAVLNRANTHFRW